MANAKPGGATQRRRERRFRSILTSLSDPDILLMLCILVHVFVYMYNVVYIRTKHVSRCARLEVLDTPRVALAY